MRDFVSEFLDTTSYAPDRPVDWKAHPELGEESPDELSALEECLLEVLGGQGSGNYGHSGRKGVVGGSGPSEGETVSPDTFKKGTDVFIHGSSSASLDSIRKNGLLAFGGGQGKSLYSSSYMAGETRQSGVYVTKDWNQALRAGENAAYGSADSRQHVGDPKSDVVIFRIRVPKDAKLERDEMKSIAEKSFRVTGNIPKEWIEGYVQIPAGEFGTRQYIGQRTSTSVGSRVFRKLAAEDGEVFFAPWQLNSSDLETLGGPGSGNFGHSGRPGEVGGSGSGGGEATRQAVPPEKVQLIFKMHAEGKSPGQIAKAAFGHYPQKDRVKAVLETYNPDGTPKGAGPVVAPVPPPVTPPVSEPKPVIDEGPTPPAGAPLTVHQRMKVEIERMRVDLANDRVRLGTPYSMDHTTSIGQRNISVVHTAAQAMISARADMKAAGVYPPGVYMSFGDLGENTYATAGAPKTININTQQSAWTNRAALGRSMRNDYQAGFHPTSDGHDILIHEMGHLMHNRSAGNVPYHSMHYDKPSDTLARQVSRYAATNKLEFVAETFTGLVKGKRYSPEVMDHYGDLDGPYVKPRL